MRFSSTLMLALPALALAEEQIPLGDKLKGWFNQVAAAVTSAVPSTPSPLHAGTSKIAGQVQHDLTLDNWKQVLTTDPTASAPTTQDWIVYINGGNVTCFGFCGNTTKAWNDTVALYAAKPADGPKFATVDCDAEPILCNSWSVGPPAIYYFNIPKPLADQSAPVPTARYIPLNRTATTAQTLKKLIVDKEYENTVPYEGYWHPFNGAIQEFGLAVPAGWVLWGFSKMPSWLPMILISFMSRSFMGRRMPQGGAPAQGAPAPAQ